MVGTRQSKSFLLPATSDSMAPCRELLLLLTLLTTFSMPLLSQPLRETCLTVDTAKPLEANTPSDVEVLGVNERACYKILSPGGDMVVALITDAENPQMYLLSPKDGLVAPYPSYRTHSYTGNQVREVLTIPAGENEKGVWQVSVVNIERTRSIVYTLVVFVSNPAPVQINPRDKLTYGKLYDRCCSAQGACSTWRSLGGRDANPCGFPGFSCDELGNITAFQLMGTAAGIHLSCTFPVDLFAAMTGLRTLSLRWHPELTGRVNFTTLANLPNLEVLDLSYTALSGPVGCGLSASRLRTLDLSSIPSFEHSRFVGDLPTCYVTKPEMVILRLSWNAFQGSLPEGGEWTKTSQLQWLALDNNYLEGELPGPYDANNKWVYNGLGRLPDLRILQLNNNRFWGHVPPSLNQPSLLQLDLSHNAFSWIVSSQILGRSTLRSLRLNNNKLSGPVPDVITSMSNLTEIMLDNNQLSGPLPTDWSKMQELVWLGLANNHFTGTLPQSVMGMPQLFFLDVSNNNFSGPIPAIPSNTQPSKMLSNLDLDNNHFTGNFPRSFGDLPAFQPLPIQTVLGNDLIFTYSFVNNSLSGPLPDFMLPPLSGNLELDFEGNDGLQCPMKFGDFAGLKCTAANPRQKHRGKKLSNVGLAFLVIGIVGGVAVIAAVTVFVLYKRRSQRPQPPLGELGSLPKEGTKNGVGHKLYRLLTQRKEQSYVKFAGDQDSWGLTRPVGGG